MNGGPMIGASLRRREDARVLRGQTRYLDDIEEPHMAHAAFVRSPYAHAGIESIAVPSRADGLVALITAADLGDAVRPVPVMVPAGAEVRESDAHPVLAAGEVRYVGQPVAMVIARSRALAEDAAELVEVEYEPRPVISSPRDSDTALMRWRSRSGDVEAAFAGADRVISGSYVLPRLIAAPMEPRGCIGSYDEAGDVLTVWCSAQDTHRPHEQLCHVLDRSASAVRVIVPDVGGAFGSKGVIAPEVAAVAAAALRLGMPVKWAEDRLENLVASSQGRGAEGDLELALDAEGGMLALRARLWCDLGGYLLTTTAVPPHTTATLIAGCYDIAVADVEVVGALTHRVPIGPYRGAGRPDAAYMLEALVDEAARQTGIDRVALRRRNLVRTFPHAAPTGLEYDSGDFERCLDLALELAGETSAADPACVRGTGIVVFVERAGGGFESAAIELLEGGRFTILSSSSPHGQGHDITFAQIAADRLGVPIDAIELRFGDSATAPPGVGTFGSRSVAMAGSAVAVASDGLVEQARALAQEVGLDTAVPLNWAALAQAADAPLRTEATFRSPHLFSSGAYAASVRIDRATGVLTVERLVAVDDSGTLINPLLVHGQVIGGIVQALGECLSEEAVYDEDGQMRSGSLLEYGLLTAADIPPIVTGEVQTPSPLNPLGAKGVGEGGAVGALAAVGNAVTDALGGRYVSPPFTAEKLWRALHEGDQAALPR